MAAIDAESSTGHLAATLRGAWRILLRRGLSFCCTEHSLSAACRAQGIDLRQLVDELRAQSERRPSTSGWEERPLRDLVAHIQTAYHRPLIEGLDLLDRLVAQVVAAHAPEGDGRLEQVAEAIDAMRAELLFHLDKEEGVLFPWILSDGGRTAMQNIRVLILEHKEANGYLERIRALTDDFHPPASVSCPAWRALYRGLAEFDAELHEHIYLEDDVLFTRVLAAAS